MLFKLFKNTKIFEKLKKRHIFPENSFTKNLATLVKKSENSDIFDGYDPI